MSTPNFQPLNAKIRVLRDLEVLRTDHFVKCDNGWQRLSPKNYLIGMRVGPAKQMAGTTFVFGEEILEGSAASIVVAPAMPTSHIPRVPQVPIRAEHRPAEPSSIVVED